MDRSLWYALFSCLLCYQKGNTQTLLLDQQEALFFFFFLHSSAFMAQVGPFDIFDICVRKWTLLHLAQNLCKEDHACCSDLVIFKMQTHEHTSAHTVPPFFRNVVKPSFAAFILLSSQGTVRTKARWSIGPSFHWSSQNWPFLLV